MRTRRDEVAAFTTKDGSEIRELMHPRAQGNRAQSLAEATLRPGGRTTLHLHPQAEEIYHVLEGRGVLTVGGRTDRVARGDTVCIPPGTPHQLVNDGDAPLRVLCACSPPYSDGDTVLLE